MMQPLLCPVLVGRDAEFHMLSAALDAAAGGHGGLFFLVGEPGVGKSRLARETEKRARARGFAVLAGRASQVSAPIPLRPVVEALLRVARTHPIPDIQDMAPYEPVLASLVPEWRPGSDGDAEISPLTVGEALLRLLTALGKRGALLVLEDLQWADPETLAVVEYLADGLTRIRALCVATVRSDGPCAAEDLVDALHARRGASVIEVPRLSESELEFMAAACLGQDSAPDPVVKQVVADCGGLPLAVEEMLSAAVSSGQVVRSEDGWRVSAEISTGIPASITASVRSRMAQLDSGAAEVIVFAAVLGRRFDCTLLPGLAGVPEETGLAAIRQAIDLQLIQPHSPSHPELRFRHSLTREAIVADLLPPDLAMRSARAAAAVEASRSGAEGIWREQAARLYQEAGEPVRAGTLLLDAGRDASNHGALISAKELLTRARDLLAEAPAGESRLLAEADEALARTLRITGECRKLMPVAARLLAELDMLGVEPPRRAVIRSCLAYAFSQADPAAAEEHLAAARAIIDRFRDPELTGRVDCAEARCAFESGDLDRAQTLARRTLTAAEAAGLKSWAAEAACEALEIIGRLERVHDLTAARDAFERACQIAASEGLAVRRIRALHDLAMIEAFETANPDRLSEVLGLAEKSGAISTIAAIELQRAALWTLGTDLDRALTAARQSQETAASLRLRRVEAMAAIAWASALGIRADRQIVERAAAQAEDLMPGDPETLAGTWGQARVIAAIFNDDLPAAHEAVTTGIFYARQEPRTAPFLAWGFWALLQAALGPDGREALREARAAGAEVARWNRGCLAYAEAVLEGRDGNKDRAAELAAQGAEQFRPCAPWWNHTLRQIVAPAALADGWGQPATWLRHAIPDLEASGHTQLASASHRILRRAGEPVPGRRSGATGIPDFLRSLGVTSREMEVLLLVGNGSSSSEIAARLVISPKTVDTHISNLLAKTDRRNRRELIAYAASRLRAELKTIPLQQAQP